MIVVFLVAPASPALVAPAVVWSTVEMGTTGCWVTPGTTFCGETRATTC